MKAALFLSILFCGTAAVSFLDSNKDLHPTQATEENFSIWMQTFGQTYSSEEMPARLSLWQESVNWVFNHNQKNETWKAGLNHMSAYTKEEKSRMVMSGDAFNVTFTTMKSQPNVIPAPNYVGRPSSIDWRDRKVVRQVKDQGQCGSCWAFSSSASVEGCAMLAGKRSVDLSPQQLVDCDGTGGCKGADVFQAMKWITEHGIATWDDYRDYTATRQSCRSAKTFVRPGSMEYVQNQRGDENGVTNLIAQGPTVVGIQVAQSFFSYKSGVYSENNCNTNEWHAVTAVGYGNREGAEAYIVKNSWGPNWGEKGYFHIAKGRNTCSVGTMAVIAVRC